MSELSEAQVLQALRGVEDHGRGDLVSLGMIAGLAIKSGHVGFTIEVDPARGPALEPLRRAAEKAVEALPGVLSVSVVLAAHSSKVQAPPPPKAAHAHPTGTAKISLPNVRFVVAIASGKGGVGKSTVAANLALALAGKGLRVAMLDADIYGPSQPRMLGIKGRPRTNADKRTLVPLENHGVKVMSMGFMVDEEQPIIWRGPMVISALQQMLSEVAWGDIDVMIIDMPPGTGDAQLTLAQRVTLAGAIIVSTPQDIALLDARKGLNMFRKVDVPVLGIIENMSYYICPNCGDRADIFSHGGARREAARMETEFLGEIPLDIAIRETSDAGVPLVAALPDSAQAAAFRRVADRVWAKIESGALQRPAPKIVIQ